MVFPKKNRSQKQAGNSDVLFFIGFFIFLGILWILGQNNKAAGGAKSSVITYANFPTPTVITTASAPENVSAGSVGSGTQTTSASGPVSPYKGMIQISDLGNGRYEYQPSKEYITLYANYSNREPINITGWSVTNGKNLKAAPNQGGRVGYGVSDRAYIPEANIRSAGGVESLRPITVAPGERVVLITGSVPNTSPKLVTASFKTNICSGYIGNLPDLSVTPSFSDTCPDPLKEEGVNLLDRSCYDFVSRLSRCHTPVFKNSSRDYAGRETGPTVDGTINLSSNCKSYIEAHYSYQACLVNHGADTGFYGKEWRVYLNRVWELWADSREVVTLYDDHGRVVDEKTYN